ncbi:Sugar kinase of the NBD/HSP70 family, may contain an N-terminal HTH domain [Nocardioides exalbidus]|uniref:Sugar kinase of the NBD/HSP70 family, may contain an N-terminal HTH domain n=1 Tax=Nocardioides exalbidus TaxID=402596 RepID=A0A1H4T832_9ACTN|nr:ROK family transcriptional regulator [Nocardioides exalbidus]SEC52596.1 Sugar kinase of the NBD/HSP70 family, may contain an N-terminal HTH domain [Nocardioides exalbidus]
MQQRSTAGTERLRRSNTGAVLRALRRLGPSTRVELARHTGLAKATVGVIVADLEEAGAVTEEGSRPGVRGRPGRPVVLRGRRFLTLGLELNVDYVSAVALDLTGDIVSSSSRPGGQVADLHDLACSTLSDHLGAGTRLVGATLAVPGLVRDDDATVAWAPNLHVAWPEVSDLLGTLVPGRRIEVSNDANCAAYAESHHGAAVGVAHSLYLTGTVGIGAGIVQDGEVMRGAAGFAGEVGHMPVGDSTAECGCGRRGCWEASIGLHAMLAAVGMSELDTPLQTAEAVAARARTDATVRAGLARVGRDVGLGLAMLSNVLDPEVVVLGGYFAPLGDFVLDPARRTLDDRLPSLVQVRPDLRPSTLGIEAAALGAAERSFDPVFTGALELSA